ncbi:MAG: TIGR02647 family protein [Porticoccaceae bacterium]|nr:TIGR02647 family protein [Porticoccaceae bacterium]
MPYNTQIGDEINILARYNLKTTQEGVKVHSSAEPRAIAAAQRLFDKGLITQSDGGYLTALGRKAAEHAQGLLLIIKS